MVVSAPAGFGKSTLLTESMAPDRRSVAWVSLDSGDSDQACTDRPPQRPRTRNRRRQSSGEPVVLVLDDYHVIDSIDVQQAMTFLLDHLPRGLGRVPTTHRPPTSNSPDQS